MKLTSKLTRLLKKYSNPIFNLVSIIKFLFLCTFFFFFLTNGIQTPKGRGANGKQLDCKKIKAVLAEYGYARGQLTEKGPETLSPTRTYANYKNIQVIETGSKIPLEDGSIIYFSYKIQNLPKDKEWIDGFKILLTFPEIQNPSGQKFTHYQVPFSIGKAKEEEEYHNEHYWSFSNSDPYEMVEGQFTYHLYYKSCLLLQHTFYTYKR
ncbi:MAG: hypothetical protein KBA66_11300 [Leptospiraceae bacterium]|nr:hypothetical protein [Leptospiraceae bacterium]